MRAVTSLSRFSTVLSGTNVFGLLAPRMTSPAHCQRRSAITALRFEHLLTVNVGNLKGKFRSPLRCDAVIPGRPLHFADFSLQAGLACYARNCSSGESLTRIVLWQTCSSLARRPEEGNRGRQFRQLLLPSTPHVSARPWFSNLFPSSAAVLPPADWKRWINFLTRCRRMAAARSWWSRSNIPASPACCRSCSANARGCG